MKLLIRLKKADCIIGVIKGYGKNSRRIFGSTATALAERSDMPIIIGLGEPQFIITASIVFARRPKLSKIFWPLAIISIF